MFLNSILFWICKPKLYKKKLSTCPFNNFLGSPFGWRRAQPVSRHLVSRDADRRPEPPGSVEHASELLESMRSRVVAHSRPVLPEIPELVRGFGLGPSSHLTCRLKFICMSVSWGLSDWGFPRLAATLNLSNSTTFPLGSTGKHPHHGVPAGRLVSASCVWYVPLISYRRARFCVQTLCEKLNEKWAWYPWHESNVCEGSWTICLESTGRLGRYGMAA